MRGHSPGPPAACSSLYGRFWRVLGHRPGQYKENGESSDRKLRGRIHRVSKWTSPGGDSSLVRRGAVLPSAAVTSLPLVSDICLLGLEVAEFVYLYCVGAGVWAVGGVSSDVVPAGAVGGPGDQV